MKVTATQYAKTLYAATKDQPAEKIAEVVAGLVKILARNNHIKNSQKIIAKYSEIYNQENNIIEAEVISCEKISVEAAASLQEFLQKKYGTGTVVLRNKVDKRIQGGVVVKVGDELLDGSVAKQLKDLKAKLSA